MQLIEIWQLFCHFNLTFGRWMGCYQAKFVSTSESVTWRPCLFASHLWGGECELLAEMDRVFRLEDYTPVGSWSLLPLSGWFEALRMEERLEAQSWLRENVAPLLKGCSVWAKRHQHQDNNAGGLQGSNMWSNANQDFGFLVPQLICSTLAQRAFWGPTLKINAGVSETSAAFCLSQLSLVLLVCWLFRI